MIGGIELETIIPLFSTNAANILKLSNSKGRIEVGFDADIIALKKNGGGNFESIGIVIAKGRIVKSENYIIKGMFD